MRKALLALTVSLCGALASGWVLAEPVVPPDAAVIRVGSDLASPPWDFLDAGGQPAGLVPEFLELLAARAKLRVQWLPAQRRERLEALLVGGQLELVVAYGLPWSKATASLPIDRNLISDQPALVRRAISLVAAPTEAGKRDEFAVLPQYLPDQVRKMARSSHPVASLEAALLDVASGRADSAIVPQWQAAWLIRERGLSQLTMQPLTEIAGADLSWRVSGDAASLKTRLESAWDQLDPAQVQALRERWLPTSKLSADAFPSPLPGHWLDQAASKMALAAIALLMLGLMGLGWLRRRERNVAHGSGAPADLVAAESPLLLSPVATLVLGSNRQGSLVVMQANKAALSLLGLADSDDHLSLAGVLGAVRSSDQDGLLAALSEALRGAEGQSSEFQLAESAGGRRLKAMIGAPSSSSAQAQCLVVLQDVTENQQLSDELAAQDARFTEIVSRLPGLIYQIEITADGKYRLLFASSGLANQWGRKREHVLLNAEAIYANVFEDDREMVREAMGAAARAHSTYSIEYRARLADGTVNWMRGTGWAAAGQHGATVLTGFVSDNTRLHQTEQKLVETTGLLHELTDAVPGFVYQLRQDADGLHRRFTFVSAGVKVHGVTPEQALSDANELYESVPKPDRLALRKALDSSAQSLLPMRTDYRVRSKSGEVFWMRSQANPKRLGTGEVVWSGINSFITEEKQHQQEALRCNTRLSALSATLPGVSFERQLVDNIAEYSAVSERAEALLGISAAAWMQDGSRFEELLSPPDRARYIAACARAASAMGVAELECRFNRADREADWLRIRLRQNAGDLASRSVYGYIESIAAEREATARVQLLERRLMELTADAPCVLLQLRQNGDGSYSFPYVSAAVLPLTGIARDTVQRDAERLLNCLSETERARLFNELEQAKRSRRALIIEFTLTHLSGSLRQVRASFSLPRTLDGAVLWSGLWLDITSLSSKIESVQQVAGVAERLKSEFLATISHEIRTPMNAILGLGQLLQKTNLNPRQHSYLAKMQSASEGLLRILNDVLDLNSVEAGTLTLQHQEFDLEQLLSEAAVTMAGKAAAKGLELIIDLPATLPARLLGDAERLDQVLNSLLSNAIKFSEQGVILVRVREDAQLGNLLMLRFSVGDQGIGISAEQQGRLFEPFSQGDASTTRKYGGVGLGLAIARNLVGLMGGEISVESSLGAGSIFEFTAALEPVPAPATPKVAPDFASLKVLYCGGHPLARELVVERLRSAGLAASGVAGLAQLMGAVDANVGEPFKLLILDEPQAVLPEADRVLRSNPGTAQMALLMLVPPGDGAMLSTAAPNDNNPVRRLIKPSTAGTVLRAALATLGRPPSFDGIILSLPEPAFSLPSSTRILLVIADELTQHVVAEWLHETGCAVRMADNGRRALELLEASSFELVLMDADLPVMDGLSAAEAIRADARFVNLPLIALSGSSHPDERASCLAAGMNEVLPKPLEQRALVAVLRRWLGVNATGSRAEAPQLSVLNLAEAILRLNGSEALLHRLLRKFVDEHRDLPATIRAALAEGDSASAERIAHTLKGMAGSLGAAVLREQAIRTEVALHAGEGIDEALAELAAVHEQTLRAMEAELDRVEAPSIDVPVQSIDFSELERLLTEQDADAKEAFESLTAELKVIHPNEVAKLSTALDNYDFDDALAVLRRIKSERNLKAAEDTP